MKSQTVIISFIILRRTGVFLAALFCLTGNISSQTSVFDQEILLPRQYSTLYSIFNQISSQTDYFFVYDTDIISSDKKVRIREENKTLTSWLEEIIDDPRLKFNIIENYILLYLPQEEDVQIPEPDDREKDMIVLEGRVIDEESKEPISYAIVAIRGETYGITTNSDGLFTLKIPDDYHDRHVYVSHLGYQSQYLPVELFDNARLEILMKTEYIPILEVLIRYYDPLVILTDALRKIRENYSQEPSYLYSFYREGVHRNNKIINYSEAFFQIYKASYTRLLDQDQVRLLQSRTISNIDQSDTLILKIRAGVKSSLFLDIVKNIPNFLDPEFLEDYDFKHSTLVSRDGKRAYAISFEQKAYITNPLYTGLLYIDMESHAFLGADFEVHPKYISKADNQFRATRNKDYRANVEKAAYSVSYKYYNGRYYLNHVRADLDFRYRRRYRLFSNNYQVFVELVTSKIGNDNVARFERSDVLHTGRVFSDGNHAYDPDFWRGYSIITPEQHITEGIEKITSRIESVVAELDDE